MTHEREILDCKVRARKYLLIKHSSRWRKKGDRVVVQSPMLDIPRGVSEVPVMRYNGEEQTAVCLIPRSDIEKDKTVYGRAQINKETTWVDTHGVALFDSLPEDEFGYKRNDKFWIHIVANEPENKETINVINLQTFEEGHIRLDKVCWFPRIKGVDGELWTPCGETRALKREGPRNYSYWAFVICQQLDGSPPTTKTRQIPTRDFEMEDRKQLSISESRSLFVARQKCMIEDPTDDGENRSSSPSSFAYQPPSRVLQTPPPTPDQQLVLKEHPPKRIKLQDQLQLHQRVQTPRENERAIETQQPASPGVDLWRRIFAITRATKGPYVLRNSLIHPQEQCRPQVHRIPRQRRLSHDKPPYFRPEPRGEDESVATDSYASTDCSMRESSPARTDARDDLLICQGLPSLEGSDFSAVAILNQTMKANQTEKLQKMTKDDMSGHEDYTSTEYSTHDSSLSQIDDGGQLLLCQDFASLDDTLLKTIMNQIEPKETEKLQMMIDNDDDESPETMEFERNHELLPDNPILTGRCSNKDPNCSYTCLSTKYHYHVPPTKCTLSQLHPSVHLTEPRDYSPDSSDRSHKHCISRLGPYPDYECLLQKSRGYKDHICCYWAKHDEDTIPATAGREYNKRKQEEALKKLQKLQERRDWIRANLEQMVPLNMRHLDENATVSMRDMDLDAIGRSDY